MQTTIRRGWAILTAAVILAIMILPIISSLTREVMRPVPHSQREAVLALGATRWEMIRMGVLRNARIGIVGAIILGLGRALGETMAVTMVIGNTPEIHRSLLSNGSIDGRVIANEFTEATSDLHLQRADRDWPGAVYGDDCGERDGASAGVGGYARSAGTGALRGRDSRTVRTRINSELRSLRGDRRIMLVTGLAILATIAGGYAAGGHLRLPAVQGRKFAEPGVLYQGSQRR